jgi:hypothetical protein
MDPQWIAAGVAGGPEIFFGGGANTAKFSRLSAPYRCSHYTGGGLTSLPSTLSYATNFTTASYGYGFYAID